MDVAPFTESLYKMLILTDMRHYAEFYLGIIRRDDDAIRFACHKGLPDFLSAFRPDRDVLEIRIR